MLNKPKPSICSIFSGSNPQKIAEIAAGRVMNNGK